MVRAKQTLSSDDPEMECAPQDSLPWAHDQFSLKYRLNDPAFFVPDRWAKTKIVADPAAVRLYKAIAQVVNGNADAKITKLSIFNLVYGAITASPPNYHYYLQ